MSTNTQEAHFMYTINEWSQNIFQKQLDIIFKNNNIKVIYDIGANVGGVSYVILSKYSKYIDKIYCIEPDYDNMNYLKNKLKKYIDNNKVICIQKGIYYGKKKAHVYGIGLCSENKIHENVGGYIIEECANAIVTERRNKGDNIFCDKINNKIFELVDLESLNLDDPDFIKIDVEGSEKNIIKNSNLIKNAKYIMLEWNYPSISIYDFTNKYLPNHKIISFDCDYLLKRNDL